MEWVDKHNGIHDETTVLGTGWATVLGAYVPISQMLEDHLGDGASLARNQGFHFQF